jgi:acyl-CoA synthetase (AMP-forming)/AMP-acid ligase II
MRAIIDKMGASAICAAYGLSEASPNVVMSDWRDPEELRVQGLAKPHDGVELRIVDGEIQVRGWNVMRGYYNNPEANAKAFTADGWLRTGDLGELTADGRLRMSGRLKDVFRVGGENVAPAEVEEVLLAHPAVETAQVIGVPDQRLGEVPCAYVTLQGALRQLPRAPLSEDRRELRVDRHDRERQGAEEEAARARAARVQTLTKCHPGACTTRQTGSRRVKMDDRRKARSYKKWPIARYLKAN